MDTNKHCWCGSDQLTNFSDDYSVCAKCGTLVAQAGLSSEQIQVQDDNHDFYGKEYWLSHQTQDYGFPDIYQRSRQDLPERCLHWLQILLTYRLPPARILELGCAHGGFVALMRWAGFDAMGLELSPWVVDFARQTFDIPVLLGMVEEQQLEPGSLDAIALYDVLEHMPDPVATMRHCAQLLKPDGIFIVQMPDYKGDKLYSEMVEQHDHFLEQMKSIEHLHLFTRRAAQEFFERLGYPFLQFEQQLFAYDMFFIASRQPLTQYTSEHIAEKLLSSAPSRIVQALLDQKFELNQLQAAHQETLAHYQMSEVDRAERLKVIESQGEELAALQALLHQTQPLVHQYHTQLQHTQDKLQHTQDEWQQAQDKLQHTQDELEQTRTKLQKTQDELGQTQGELEQTLRKLEQTQTELDQTLRKLERSKVLAERLKEKADQSQSQLEEAQAEIAAMKTSKFWKIRSAWFQLKQTLRLTNDSI
jgi:2-polyprenyl-3-methyl-5-hydroxy-6-metoxy-1,4-benzoquinol methylase/uncharacterized coiled-coil DUF342 family protein